MNKPSSSAETTTTATTKLRFSDDLEEVSVPLSEHLFECQRRLVVGDPAPSAEDDNVKSKEDAGATTSNRRLETAQQWEQVVSDTDAYISIGMGPSQGHLPAFDTKTFRKAYTLLFWVRPRILVPANAAGDDKSGDGGTKKDAIDGKGGDAQGGGDAKDNADKVKNSKSKPAEELPPANYLYRLSTQSQDNDATGVCVTCTPWKLVQPTGDDDDDDENVKMVETMLTAYSLPHHQTTPSSLKQHYANNDNRYSYSSFLQTPLVLQVDTWSLVGITHTFPYLKRPMWTLVVNGAVRDQGPLDYPVTDQVLEYNLFLQNVVLEPLLQPLEAVLDGSDGDNPTSDDAKTASQLNAKPQYKRVPWKLDWAALSIYPVAIAPTLQAVACQAGVATALSHNGRIIPHLPAVPNWSKGSALEGPKVGVPLVVHSAALDMQKAAGTLILAVGAHSMRMLGSMANSTDDSANIYSTDGDSGANNRIVCTFEHVPGNTLETPRVGLLEPQAMIRLTEDTTPVYYMNGRVTMYNAVGQFCINASCAGTSSSTALTKSTGTGNSDQESYRHVELKACTNNLSLALQEQGLLVALVLPFFLALRPPNMDRPGSSNDNPIHSINNDPHTKSHGQLHALYHDNGKLAAQLIRNLAAVIRTGGSRVHEEVLQHGTIHVLASTLRLSLCRAYQLGFFTTNKNKNNHSNEWSLADWLSHCHTRRLEEATQKRLERPPIIPQPIVDACLDLVDACCGPLGTAANVNSNKAPDVAATSLAATGRRRQRAKRHCRMDDLEPHVQIQRTCDLALTAVFGFCLDSDLWRACNKASHAMVAAVADRYGDDCWTGGYLLRSQMSVQFMLDTVRAEPAARLLQSMLISSLSNKRSISQGEHDVNACVNALCEAQLGSVAAHVALKGIVYLLVWCEVFPDSAADDCRAEDAAGSNPSSSKKTHPNDSGSGTADQKMKVASRLGRNLLVANFHNVVGPMLLSRTIFNGNEASSSGNNAMPCWENHWQLTMLLFSWVASIAGPEGLPPAISTGSLLLASGIAGSLHGALGNADRTLLSALYLPPPAMALMIGSSLRDEWSYTDLLADRLLIMMPMLPGMVVSFLPNPTEKDKIEAEAIPIGALRALCNLLTSVGGAFHRVYGGTIHSAEGTQRQFKQRRGDGSSDSIKAARTYVPHFLTCVMLLERQIVTRRNLEKQGGETAVSILRPQTTNEAMRRTDMESWIDVTSESVINEVEVSVMGDTESQDTTIATLGSCQTSVLNTASGLIAHAMNVGGAGTSLSLWTAVLKTFEESLTFYASTHPEDSDIGASGHEEADTSNGQELMVRDVLCRVVAQVLCKALKRDYQWEMWTYEMSSAVSRLCVMIEEKHLLQPPCGSHELSPDQVLLICALVDILEYGRDATGWCQLTLPAISANDPSGDLAAASKLLLPVLQPCLRLVTGCLALLNSSQIIKVPVSAVSSSSQVLEPKEFTREKLVGRVLAELDLTLTAAIVGQTFSAARDTALSAMAILRKTLDGHRSAEDKEAATQCGSLLCKLTGELRERYKGERRLRETALFDAYDDNGEDRTGAAVAEDSKAMERLMLGGELFSGGGGEAATTPKATDQISSEDNSESKQVSDDMVVFHEPHSSESARPSTLGYAEYEGLSSALDECHEALEREKSSQERPAIALSSLQAFLDAWDSAADAESTESELVDLFGSVDISAVPVSHGLAQQSEAASTAMSTFFELTAAEKSRAKEVTTRYMPSYRNSRFSYTERFCWARFSEFFPEEADSMWERGICDGNRDARSRLATFPISPQFPRYIPKYLDHGSSAAADPSEDEAGESSPQKRNNVAVPEIDELTKNLLEAGNLEIVDITKKEVVDDVPDEEEFPKPNSMDEGDEFFDELPMHTSDDNNPSEESGDRHKPDEVPSRNDVNNETSTNLVDSPDDDDDDEEQLEDGPTKASGQSITSSAFSTPPDNASSSLGLMNSAAASLIELHLDNCLHVKAEGSRQCKLLLTRTHLILEYDGDDDGLYEGELMAAREEADRQRMIDEVGGPYGEASADDAFQLRAEKRQREIAAHRPKSIRWNLSEASHIYLRRYRLRDSSIEIFFIPTGGSAFGGYGTFSPAASIFLDFGPGYEGGERRDNAAFAIMKRTPPQAVKHWPDRSEQFIHDQISRLTLGWVEGRVSNFDYLLHLNMLAGRSYNDICQYPVMPWVLADYTSEEVPDLTNRDSFRDLSKPVGALNPERLADFVDRFESFADPSIPKFMYGSHYSTSAGVVLHFLVRLHPFAGLHRQLQSGHFDVADRLFSSIPRTWSMCTGSSAAEVKELTPEWYCNPAFLRNGNNFKLGTSQEGELIDNVTLPPWANGDPDKFVEIMRAALESEICSEMLPDWIDLIFGRKQQGSEAVKANNVFFYLTYYGSVDVASIEDEGLRQATELQIAHFGQCPRQLLKRSHVRRLPHGYHKLSFFQLLSTYAQKGLNKLTEDEENAEDKKRRSLTGEMGYLPFFSAPISHWVHLDAPPPGPHADLISLRLAGTDRCLAVDAKGTFHTFRWAWRPEEEASDTHFDAGCFIAQRELPRFKTLPSLMYTPSTGAKPVVAISKTLFANRSVLLVLSAGDASGGLGMQLVDPVKGNIRGEVTVSAVHSGQISCIATDPIGTAAGHGGVGGELAILGSTDGNASIWRFMSSHYLPMRPRIRLSGHDGKRIHGVALCATSHLAATISSHRCCIHAIGNGSVIRSFGPPENDLFDSAYTTTTRFAPTAALAISIQGFVVAVCETLSRSNSSSSERVVRSLQLFNMGGKSLGCKPLEDWRGLPTKIQTTPDGTAAMVCCGRGVTLHRLSACHPLDFLDEWQITEEDNVANMAQALDLDLGPSLNRPVIAAAACSSGVLRLHALPGISAWSHRHNKGGLSQTVGSALAKPAQRLNKVVRDGFGIGKHLAGVGRDIGKEVKSDVKERGVGGFLGGVFGKKKG